MRFLIFLIVIVFLSCREEFKPFTISDTDHGVAFVDLDELGKQGIAIDDGLYPIFFVTNPNQPLVSQPILENDQLTGFLVKADSFSSLTVELVAAESYPEFKPLTNIRLAKKQPELHEVTVLDRLPGFDTKKTSPVLQMEGPAWENEYVAFRNYFDQRNGMDIFGKQVDTLVLDKVGIPGAPSYHDLQDWGQDVLKVGNSLGAGSIALQIGDSLYRIAPGAQSSVRILYEGPLRSAFELLFNDWNIGGRVYQVQHVIGIQSGTRYYESDVKVSGLKGDEYLVSGIVNLDSDSLYRMEGTEQIAFGTFDRQAFGGEHLGMAIGLDKADFVKSFETPDEGRDITSTYGVSMRLYEDKPTSFKFYSCWEYENERFKNLDGFVGFLNVELK